MSSQIQYYNQFGKLYAESILSCPEPEYWTTDYMEKGRIYFEMKKRIDQQKELVDEYFTNKHSVLDIGCGFGRQAMMLGKMGFEVTGTDTSDVFIQIAKKLFEKNNYRGEFICTDIISRGDIKYDQILLLDVAEHIKPSKRKLFFTKIADLSNSGTVLIVSLPHVKNRPTSIINNRIRRSITQHLPYFLKREEHPYPIPEKWNILNLTAKNFSLLKFIGSADTDYYVFRRN